MDYHCHQVTSSLPNRRRTTSLYSLFGLAESEPAEISLTGSFNFSEVIEAAALFSEQMWREFKIWLSSASRSLHAPMDRCGINRRIQRSQEMLRDCSVGQLRPARNFRDPPRRSGYTTTSPLCTKRAFRCNSLQARHLISKIR